MFHRHYDTTVWSALDVVKRNIAFGIKFITRSYAGYQPCGQ